MQHLLNLSCKFWMELSAVYLFVWPVEDISIAIKLGVEMTHFTFKCEAN